MMGRYRRKGLLINNPGGNDWYLHITKFDRDTVYIYIVVSCSTFCFFVLLFQCFEIIPLTERDERLLKKYKYIYLYITWRFNFRQFIKCFFEVLCLLLYIYIYIWTPQNTNSKNYKCPWTQKRVWRLLLFFVIQQQQRVNHMFHWFNNNMSIIRFIFWNA